MIDLDGARLHPGPLGFRARQRALRRLERSYVKSCHPDRARVDLRDAIYEAGGQPVMQGFLTAEGLAMVGAELVATAEAIEAIEQAQALEAAATLRSLEALATIELAAEVVKPETGRRVALNGGLGFWFRTLTGWQRTRDVGMLTRQNGAELEEILACPGDAARPVVDSTYPLTREGVRDAFERLKSRRARGKIVIDVA